MRKPDSGRHRFAKIFDYQPRPNFSVANGAAISTAPTLDFSAQPQPPKANAAGE
ncbi:MULTISPECIES: hypothetical protein [Burkholderia]|uniref:hypothetical protein n=1 Tax=Burkholderia TaxID=32008 RepID=UPI00197E5C51